MRVWLATGTARANFVICLELEGARLLYVHVDGFVNVLPFANHKGVSYLPVEGSNMWLLSEEDAS